jgi:hypothetical protein
MFRFATQEAKSLIGFTTDVVDVAFPFEVIADCYSHIEHPVLVICYNILNGASSKIDVEMLALS